VTPRAQRIVLWTLTALAVVVVAGAGVLLADAMRLRYERDVSRMVFNDNLELLDRLQRQTGEEADSLRRLTSGPEPARDSAYLVVSIEEHRLWYRMGDSIVFTTLVATGTGKILERSGSDTHWRFETPRGRLTVVSLEENPVWVAPDWHYVEEAQRRGLGVTRLNRGQRIETGDGGWLTVEGSEVVRRYPDGRRAVLPAGDHSQLVAGGNLIIPPFGTNQRKYAGVLGTHRLNLGNGYAIHGTNQPETIGRSVSHGCIRVTNDDIARLYESIKVGTPVYIY
jgi:hypothetical protein